MTSAAATIVVVPRERFTGSMLSIDSIYSSTPEPFELIYVDAGSPPGEAELLRREATRRGFRLIRREGFLSTNAARNLGLAEVTTRYVVFIDNDVVVDAGWLNAMVSCADETGAWIVGPVTCKGDPSKPRVVHLAGGQLRVEITPDGRRLVEAHKHISKPLAAVERELKRERTDLIEFHCMLVRTEALRSLGGLDPMLLALGEHNDLCLRVTEAGGEIWLEPTSVVTYVPPIRLERTDLPYFVLRWSPSWCEKSLDHFAKKWDLPRADPALASQRVWSDQHRTSMLRGLRGVRSKRVRRWLARGISRVLMPWLASRAEV